MSRSGLVALPAVVLLLFGTAVAASAQGLGDAAARERQKREAKKASDPGRVYSNDDLPVPDPEAAKKKGAEAPASTTAAADAEAGGSGDDAASVFAARKQRVADAEAAAKSAQSAVDGLEARIRQLQDMLNPMSPGFIYGSATTGDMAGAEARARQELTQSEARLAEARKALAAANQELENAQLGRLPSPRP